MSRNILVVGNCHIGGIAAALKQLFPSDQISAIPFNPNVFKGNSSDLAKQIASADVVLGGDFVQVFSKEHKVVPRNFISIPRLYFSAFHPDIVAARIKSTGANYPSRYNSAICVWAYSNGLDPSDAARLFSKNTFGKLGYFKQWDKSVAQMRTAFETSRLDFDRFFLAVKRNGVFMHTVNHPRVSLLIWIAKLLAVGIGHDRNVWSKDVLIDDALGKVEIWPVYPEVAYELALPGSYNWFVERGKVIDGLRSYIDYAYEKYSKSGICQNDFAIAGVNQLHYQTVLSAALRGE
ncbi:MAG: hypothetical protein KJ795_01365 [Gammaproteobacteria bacterium]|nr:hypothetical protein [Gammaproteobacteria bacterium]MBU1777819.1 hypothetical protein [Gammaproteobacteria bacterium]